MDPEEIARVCHEANRALQTIFNDPAIDISPPWDECPSFVKRSVLNGVKKAQEGVTSEQLHEAWCAELRAAGWTYGARKSASRRTHPCLVPYAELSLENRLKDSLFLAIVNALS